MEEDGDQKRSVTEAWASPLQSSSSSQAREKLDWQGKLAELQSHHKQESLQQQKEHLEQLQSFKEQLLFELSSTQAGEGASTSPPSSLTGSPQPPAHSSCSLNDTLTSLGLNQSFEYLQLPSVTSPLIRTSTVESLTPKQACSPAQSPTKDAKENTPLKGQQAFLQRSPFEHSAALIPAATHSPCGSPAAGYKAALVEKHNKHVRDLKEFYEAEILELKQQLEACCLSSTSEKAKRDASSQLESAEVKRRCSQLDAQLEENQRRTRELERALKRSEERMAETRGRQESLEKLVSVLQARLEASRTQLKEQDEASAQLRSDLQDTAEELQFWKEQRSQDGEKMDQLLYEFEVVQTEKRKTQESVLLLEKELRQCAVDIEHLESAVGKYRAMETQYKSKIGQLEDEVRSLQLINNRLNSQTTHYQLGTYKTPQASTRPTEEKHSSIGRVMRTPPPSSQRRPEFQIPPPSSSSSAPRGGGAHLTRKKWLEPSDPGLIIGGASSPANPSAQSDVAWSMAVDRSPSDTPTKQPKASVRHSPLQEATAAAKTHRQVDGGAPVNYDSSDPVTGLDSTLKAVRQGSLVAGDKDGPYKSQRRTKAGAKKNKSGSVKDDSMGIEERVQQYMQMVQHSEQKLATLQTEKKQLQSALQRAPKSEGRVTARAKQAQYDMEQRLDEVDREISSLKMVLRAHHVLGK